MLTKPDTDYLISRGYTPELIKAERWASLNPGQYTVTGCPVTIKTPCIAALCHYQTGTVTALHTVNTTEKRYNKFLTNAGYYLPVLFGNCVDYENLLSTLEVVVTEGVFDRIAVKRCDPSLAVFSLMGLSASNRVVEFLKMTANRVWILLDGDAPGLKAADYLAARLNEVKIQHSHIIHPYKDAGDWFKAVGVYRMRKQLSEKMSLTLR